MLTDHWDKQGYNRNPQEVADVSSTFAEYMDNYSKIAFVDGKQLLFSGPNAGGSSPVFGLYVKDGIIVSSKSYSQLKVFNNFLNSCDAGFVSGYINNLDSEQPNVQDIEDDLACAGIMTFEETEFW